MPSPEIPRATLTAFRLSCEGFPDEVIEARSAESAYRQAIRRGLFRKGGPVTVVPMHELPPYSQAELEALGDADGRDCSHDGILA